MGEKIAYRHNIMSINSIETFVSIRGGYNNSLRDVYFVRAVGECNGLVEQIKKIDQKMGQEMAQKRLKYTRIHVLPQISDKADSDFYAAVYEQWKNGQNITLKHVPVVGLLQDVLKEAYSRVIGFYTGHKSAASESMIRNFAVKIMFWLDRTMEAALAEWNEKSCIKVIADNVVKEQEYLFYLFLTFLGCDVLLVENRSDVEVAEELKKYSCVITLGDLGASQIGEYAPYTAASVVTTVVQSENSIIETPQMSQPVIRIPRHPGRTSNVQTQTQRIETQTVARQQSVPPQVAAQLPGMQGNSLVNAPVSSEKSFEELASLASSIVLIAIHDSRGEVIGTGSGIMIGSGGYILTNNHVAAGGRFYSVRIEEDEEVYRTDEVIKYNPVTDLAVIRIQKNLTPLPIYNGTKKLVRGQKVVAIGSPLGLFNSVSDGIISGFRKIDGVDMIQFTAPISHGSSGGAVLNMQGEVIGISTAGIDRGQNINLAIGYESILAFASSFMR